MTARRPLVIVNGLQQELPAGDNITDPVLAAISQIAGLNGTTLLEVEAKYGAARIVLRPNDGGSLIEQAFDVGHYAMGIAGSYSATTTFVPSDMLMGAWFGPGYCVIRKIEVMCGTSAVSGTRAGRGNIVLSELKPAVGSPGVNNWATPPNPNGNLVNIATQSNFHSLKTRQLAPEVIMAYPGTNFNPTGSMNWTASINNAVYIGAISFGVKSQVGQDLKPTNLLDLSAGSQPMVLEPSQGFLVNCAYPAAVTSQVVNYAVNIVWDEWYPMPQVVL
jgi:hypothetical protein